MVARAGQEIHVDSAGTGGWHVGKPPYEPAIRAAAARGYDLSRLHARQVVPGDFERFDLIVGMDADNLAAMRALRPTGNSTPLRLMLDYADGPTGAPVPDPYHTGDFEEALDLIEAASRGLLAALRAETG